MIRSEENMESLWVIFYKKDTNKVLKLWNYILSRNWIEFRYEIFN